MTISIRPATTENDFEQVRMLFRAYGGHLAANPSGAGDICIEGFEQEIVGLPGPYAAPSGVLLLAEVDGVAAGCVALRVARPKAEVAREERSCEMKRLWTGDAWRRLGLGRGLVKAAIAWARAAGYQAMYLDTAPAAMPAAQAIYHRLGFEQIERYNTNPVQGIVFFRLGLN